MKAEILKILQLQEEGKLTRDQAAELLAILADQAREKTGETAPPPKVPSEGTGGAPGPRGGSDSGSFAASSSAAIHGLVDTAIGVGSTIGRVASVFGGEVVNMVHRDEGGNSVTLSKVDAPAGEAYAFNANTINVSKISNLTLHQAEVTGNTVNASKIAHLDITRGRFTQCNVSGSSLSNVTIAGPLPSETAALTTPGGEGVPTAGIRGVTFNASKFSRIHLLGASALEVSTIQAAAVKDWTLTGSTLRESKMNDANVAGLALEQSAVTGLMIERAHVQGLKATGATLEQVTLSGLRVSDLKITGGTWNDVKIRREAASIGGRDCLISETTFDNCTLTGCEFAGCTFRRTTLRNLKLAGLAVRNVDFTGLTLESEEAFRRAAGL